ncbi:alpha/beta fold hydrolase [Schaalia sp. 19OD2882]|uniref:alpha/beta hydrolase n=1 Tax=Schaalia sp. 19OD2882 TaxID=2794089 RepID=UPI001C1ED040|nr:alpha/beta hydrolase [Schaalia sp. 19OD2882]QWW19181.1 alpha/beta fold hydrolase [Schaalia sp. 19OD2882]
MTPVVPGVRPRSPLFPRLVPLASCALLLAACSSAPGVDMSSSAHPDSMSAVPVASDTGLDASWQAEHFSSFYSQEIAWTACEGVELPEGYAQALSQAGVDAKSVKCATVKAPMNWADPTDERTVDLAIVRIPSTGDPSAASPLFGNPGGPGASGVEYTLGLPLSPDFSGILSSHDLWGFDPRGIGASTPLSCKSESEVRAVQLAECIEANPITHYMGTSQVARDMEMLRALSGAERLDYLGYSYGTMLGATYATLFPDKAGRMILDSAEDAQWGSLVHSFDQQVAVGRAAAAMAAACPSLRTSDGTPASCPFTDESGINNLKKTLDSAPLKGSGGAEFNGQSLIEFVTSSLYGSPADRAESLTLLTRATSSNQEAVDALIAKAEESKAEVDTAGEIVACHSFPRMPDIQALVSDVKETELPSFLKDDAQSAQDVLKDFADLSCSTLPEFGQDITTSFDASRVTTPILVFGVTGDHATPYQYAQSLTKQLGNAVLVTLEDVGHGASFSGKSACADKIASKYLIDGVVPDAGTTCSPGPAS